MKKWNRTIFVWNFVQALETCLEIDDPPSADILDEWLHRLHHMSVWSSPDGSRTLVARVIIKRYFGAPTTKRQAILARLSQLNQTLNRSASASTLSGSEEFIFKTKLKRGEEFCTMALKVARLIIQALGVADPWDKHLASFGQPQQETFVLVKDHWIGFGDYLRHVHKLPKVAQVTTL
ncbi:MAG: hypothetical protein V1853_04795 [bacterium]